METTSHTFETVWATLDRVGDRLDRITEKQAETDRQMKETDRQMKETDRQMKETDRQRQENERFLAEQFAKTDRKIDKVNATLGAWAKNQGDFAEEYFFNSFENGKTNFFGEKFDEISKNLTHFWQGVKDEYDIVLYNHTSVALIEVKYKAHKNDVPDVLKKADTFRILFPNYKDFKIYLGLASMSFYPELEEVCIKEGIAIIKQVGDTVVINDKHLKVF